MQKKKTYLKTVALTASILFLPTVGLAIPDPAQRSSFNEPTGIQTVSGQVKIGNFKTTTSEPLIGDFASEVKEVIQTLSSSAGALDDAWCKFSECNAQFASNSIDEAHQLECLIGATSQGISVYREQKGSFDKLGHNLADYRSRLSKITNQTRQSLTKEQQNLNTEQKKIVRSEAQAQGLIKKIGESDHQAALSAEQSELIWDVADGLQNQLNKSRMYESFVSQLNDSVVKLENGDKAIAQVQSSVRRVSRNFVYRIEEASEFNRLISDYGLNRARAMETAGIVDAFSGILPEIEKVFNNIPDFEGAMKNRSGGSDTIIASAKPQTVGDALALLQSFVNRGGQDD